LQGIVNAEAALKKALAKANIKVRATRSAPTRQLNAYKPKPQRARYPSAFPAGVSAAAAGPPTDPAKRDCEPGWAGLRSAALHGTCSGACSHARGWLWLVQPCWQRCATALLRVMFAAVQAAASLDQALASLSIFHNLPCTPAAVEALWQLYDKHWYW